MLYFYSLSADADSPRLPIADRTADLLERALLAVDANKCEQLFSEAMSSDSVFGEWARREALGSCESNDSVATKFWSEQLATKLAERIHADVETANCSAIQNRLPMLVLKLAACERELAKFDERLEHEKLESLKELAYGAGHEVNNPLANIAARAQTLLADEPNPERQRKLAAIHRQAMRAHEMIADLMLFARPPKLEPAPCDLGQLVRQVASELRDRTDERSIALTCDVGTTPIEIECDATQIALAIAAVINNAIEAVRENGHISAMAQAIDIQGERAAEVTIADDGPGIPPDVRTHIFDPFFSGREAGRGLGFGLSKCWRIITDHGGRIVVRNLPGGGAEFTIILPNKPPAV